MSNYSGFISSMTIRKKILNPKSKKWRYIFCKNEKSYDKSNISVA